MFLEVEMSSIHYGPIQASDNSRLHLGDNHFYGDQGWLKHVPGALYDAYGLEHRACHPGTRRELLEKIERWAEHPTSPSIFWLNGMAGAGKSTISYTVAERLNRDRDKTSGHAKLGASFFFKRGEGDRGSAALLFPTIVRQLAQKVSGLDILVTQAVERNPDICSKSLGEQFRLLIRQPLQQLVPPPNQSVYIIVVDALDECKTDEIDVVLRLWSEVPRLTEIRLRLFVTSRPDLPVQLGFRDMSTDTHRDVILHEVPRPVIENDIFVYFRDSFTTIRKDFNGDPLCDQQLEEDWPGEKVLHELTRMAVPLFIVAATIYRFIHNPDEDARDRLTTILTSQQLGYMSQLAQTYMPVLEQVAVSRNYRQTADEERLYAEFRMIAGSIVILAEPLSRAALATLLHVPPKTVALRLKPLYSVLQIPTAVDAPIRPLHLSFGEFLTSSEISDRPFAVNSTTTHVMLFTKCIELLSRPDSEGLRENMCDLGYPGQSRQEITRAQVTARLPPEMQYACRYWIYHAQQGKSEVRDNDVIHTFLQRHFLHWLEALSLMDCLTNAIDYLVTLQLLVSGEGSTHINTFLEDARRFILANRYICERAPLQVYSSAIVFAPQRSVVRQVCGKLPGWMKKCPVTPGAWNAELQKLEGHTDSVSAVTFSPDGLLLVSASDDKTVRMWDAKTGQEVQKLIGHTESVSAVAFSPDGSLLASASDDYTIRLWDPKTGREEQRLEVHTQWVKAVTFSPDGPLLASVSNDYTVQLWDTKTGQEVQRLEGHTQWLKAVAFSLDGSLLASASDDNTLRLWDVKKGQEEQRLEGHTESVSAVAFSPDGSLLASASDDKTVRLWDTKTGQEVQRLEGHTDWVRAVTFSPDGSLLASASWGGTIRLWDVKKGQEEQRLEGHTHPVTAMAFSPHGSLLASASDDYTVRLWDPKTGQKEQRLEGHTKWVRAMAFSPDGSLLASASGDYTVRLWDAKTGQEVQRLEVHTHFINTVAFSPDGSLLAAASDEKTIRLWDTKTGQEVQRLEEHTKWITVVAFSPDGSLLASASDDNTVRLWDTKTGQEIQRLEGHTQWVWAVAFSRDGSLLASVSDDKTVRLWDTATGQEVQRLEEHTRSVKAVDPVGEVEPGGAVAFSPDGSLLASASCDTVRMWDVKTGHQIQVLENYPYISKIDFTSDGRALLTNRGCIHIGVLPPVPEISEPGIGNSLLLKNQWLEYGKKRVLWLPHDYRSGVSAAYGNMMAIGRPSGLVTFLEIQYA